MTINLLEIGALALTLVFFGILWFLNKKKHVDFGLLTLLGTAFGIIVGLIFKENFKYVALFGTIFANVISAVVIPLLFFSIISSITNLKGTIHVQRIGFKSVAFLLLNTLSASLITLAFALVLNVGRGYNIDTSAYEAHEVPAFTDTLVALFPRNLADAWVSNAVVPIIVFALIIALAYNRLAESKEDVSIFKKFIDAGNKVLGEAVSWLMDFTPYAVVSLIARAVGRSKVADLLPLGGVLIVAYIICAIQLFGVESLYVALIGHLNPLHFIKGIREALVVAFTSQSSVGTLPVTQRSLVKNLGVKEDVASFTTGLGANLGMPGCAGMWPTLLAVFTVNALGLNYGPLQYAGIVLLTLAVSIGTVGVPGTATITATALFAAAGLPVEMIVLLAPISSIVDMARTATNVGGAAEAALLVAKTEGLIDVHVYNDKNDEVVSKNDEKAVHVA